MAKDSHITKEVEAEAKEMLEDFLKDVLNDFIDWRSQHNNSGSVEDYLKQLKKDG